MLRWLTRKAKPEVKPRIVGCFGLWYCGEGVRRHGSMVLYFGSLGKGASPTEAYWNWRAQ